MIGGDLVERLDRVEEDIKTVKSMLLDILKEMRQYREFMENKRTKTREAVAKCRAKKKEKQEMMEERRETPSCVWNPNRAALPYDRWARAAIVFLTSDAKVPNRGLVLVDWIVCDWNWYCYKDRPFTKVGHGNNKWQGAGVRDHWGDNDLFGKGELVYGTFDEIGFWKFDRIACYLLECIAEDPRHTAIDPKELEPLRMLAGGMAPQPWGPYKVGQLDFDPAAFRVSEPQNQKAWRRQRHVFETLLTYCKQGVKLCAKLRNTWPHELEAHFSQYDMVKRATMRHAQQRMMNSLRAAAARTDQDDEKAPVPQIKIEA